MKSFLIIALGLFLVVLAAGVALWGTEVASVRAVTVSGTEVLDASKVSEVVQEVLGEKTFLNMLSGNMVAFPADRISEQLTTQFPRIKDVRIERDFVARTVHVRLAERALHGIYCTGGLVREENEPSEENKVREENEEENEKEAEAEEEREEVSESEKTVTVTQCAVVDGTGVVFARAPETEGSLLLTIVDTRANTVALGSTVLDADKLSVVTEVWQRFREEVPAAVQWVVIHQSGAIEVRSIEGWGVFIAQNQDFDTQFVALREFLASNAAVIRSGSITTIDLRVPGRIYYQ